jgi:hypothetical protein
MKTVRVLAIDHIATLQRLGLIGPRVAAAATAKISAGQGPNPPAQEEKTMSVTLPPMVGNPRPWGDTAELEGKMSNAIVRRMTLPKHQLNGKGSGDNLIIDGGPEDVMEYRIETVDADPEDETMARVGLQFLRRGHRHPGQKKTCWRPHVPGFPHCHFVNDDPIKGEVEDAPETVKRADIERARRQYPGKRIQWNRPFVGLQEITNRKEIAADPKDAFITNFMVKIAKTHPRLNYRERKRLAHKAWDESRKARARAQGK